MENTEETIDDTYSKLTARGIYECVTGDLMPDDQIAISEWHLRYVAWMEDKITELSRRAYKKSLMS